jgi:LmbE family N-acetylglucosaminyl deacetylase
MSTVLVIAAHPDDETLGCGGTLLRHRADGDELHWLIVTTMSTGVGFTAEQISVRENEIGAITSHYGFAGVTRLGLETTQLDTVSIAGLTQRIAEVFDKVRPSVVYVNHHGDAHTDHRAVFDAVAANTKWFRHPSVQRVLAYETLSETDAAVNPWAFNPTVFVDISDYLEDKLAALAIYRSEVAPMPFPRSPDVVRALATVRGGASGFSAAEAFVLLRERY